MNLEQMIDFTASSAGTMSLPQNITKLIKRLSFLGYRSYQLKIIIREAIGADSLNDASDIQYIEIQNALEKYEQLGSAYIQAYSK